MLKTKEGAIYYEVHGLEKHPVLVFTHGAGLNCRMFDAQLAALKDKYRIVVWDMPGHGKSYRLDGPLDFSQQSAHIMAILDELQVKQAVLGGHSLGSWVSQEGAVKFPERVQAIVSIAGTPLSKPLSKLFILMFQIYNETSRIFPEKALYRWAARQKATTSEAQQFYEQSLTEIGRKQMYYIMKGMLAASRIKISAPTQPLLLTHGEHENPKSTINSNIQWHAATPGSNYAALPGAGHNCNQDNPDAFNQALLSFLASIGL